jgi:DNA mismatch repair ATPase MutS
MIGTLGMALSVASWRSSLKNYCTPIVIDDKKLINVENMVHPLLVNCVPNSLTLKGVSMLPTGSNMSGKTTFMRAIGLNVLFAQTLNTVLASKYEAPFMNIRTAIRFSDDITESSSYYLTEVKQAKKLLEDSEQKAPMLFIIDELFKGTNTVERIAAAKAILTYLNRTNHFVLVSTHDIELTKLLEKERYDMYYFQESIIENIHTFTYKPNAGIMTERNTLRLLEINDYPNIVTDLAKETAEEISRDS